MLVLVRLMLGVELHLLYLRRLVFEYRWLLVEYLLQFADESAYLLVIFLNLCVVDDAIQQRLNVSLEIFLLNSIDFDYS